MRYHHVPCHVTQVRLNMKDSSNSKITMKEWNKSEIIMQIQKSNWIDTSIENILKAFPPDMAQPTKQLSTSETMKDSPMTSNSKNKNFRWYLKREKRKKILILTMKHPYRKYYHIRQAYHRLGPTFNIVLLIQINRFHIALTRPLHANSKSIDWN